MQPTHSLLTRLAAKYVWWKAAAEAVEMPERVVAQAMNLGSYDDVQELAQEVGEDYLRGVLARAEVGQFNARSWHYWNLVVFCSRPL